MSEHRPHAAGEGGHGGGYDREISLRGIVIFGIALALILVASLAAMWVMSGAFKAREVSADPKPSPLAEANARRLPPEPRLEPSPPKAYREWRRQEEAMVSGYGWADERARVARIPLDRAMEIVLEKGLPVPPPLPAAPASPQAAPAGPAERKGGGA